MVLNVRERCKRIWETACPGAMGFHRQQLQSQHPVVLPLWEPWLWPVPVPGFAHGTVPVASGEGEGKGSAGGALVMSRSTNALWLPLSP